MNITIDESIMSKTKAFSIGVLEADVTVYEEKKVDQLIVNIEQKIRNSIDIKDVIKLESIIDGRNAYKQYGKDPSRYRLAVESLYRRLAKGNKLYRINNVVDLGNIVSIITKKSVAVLDYEKITGDVLIRLGNSRDEFYGIGRGKINIENIPLYEDDKGPFGSTTSDTERTMITSKTTKILLFIISFNGPNSLTKELEKTILLYRQYAKGNNFKSYII